MRTNIELDDALVVRALAVTGLRTKKAVVHEGLRLLVALREQEEIRSLRGQLRWEGDLDELRRARDDARQEP